MANVIYTTKYSFSAGEVSELTLDRLDLERTKIGCKLLRNMIVLPQGPITRRSGFQFIHSITDLGLHTTDPKIRLEKFVFNKTQTYCLVFFKHTSGAVRLVFAAGNGLIVYPDPPPTECPVGTPISPLPTEGDIVYVDFPSTWDIYGFDLVQSGDSIYFAQSGLKPYVLKRYSHTCWTLSEITFANQPTEWSNVNGWPECVALSQQRLSFLGTNTYRGRAWLSRAGDQLNFGKLGSTLVDADAVSFTLDSGEQNKILWAVSSNGKLFVGTFGDEWIVKGVGSSVISPVSGVDASNPTNQGSEKIKPLKIGSVLLFVENHGRAVNEFVYDYTGDSFKATDITVLASHLTEYESIVNWTYQKTPNSIVWSAREGGGVIGLTYQRQHQVVAYHSHDIDGDAISVCSVPGQEREDDLWIATKRNVGGNKYYLEKKAPQYIGEDHSLYKLLDCHASYSGTATDEITGLDFLEGREVSIMADGAEHPPLVVSSGAITLEYEATNVLVGLPYVSKVIPVFPSTGLRDGDTVNREENIVKVTLSLYNSLGFSVGVIKEDGLILEEKPFRSPNDSTGEAPPLFTGTFEVDGFEGKVGAKSLVITQDTPLPLTIKSITKRYGVV